MRFEPLLVAAALVAGLAAPLLAQEPSSDDLKEANNPLADVQAFNVQNYYVPDLTGVDGSANTFWLRYAVPVKRFLIRASLPLPTVPTGGGQKDSGIGDVNLFAAYSLVQNKTTVLGVGPLIVAPTANEPTLGAEKWQAGLAGVFFKAPNPKIQYGGLLTWQGSFAGEDAREDTSLLVAQPFGFWQLGGGTYLRTAPLWVFNLKRDTYHIPFGFGIGKVIVVGNTVFNIFIEPQFTMLQKGAGQPNFQVYTALNMQFK